MSVCMCVVCVCVCVLGILKHFFIQKNCRFEFKKFLKNETDLKNEKNTEVSVRKEKTKTEK